jgi:hypothetical protein
MPQNSRTVIIRIKKPLSTSTFRQGSRPRPPPPWSVDEMTESIKICVRSMEMRRGAVEDAHVAFHRFY